MEKQIEEKAKAGRKKISDKKVPVTIYRNQSEIDRLGGRENVRVLVNQLLTDKLN
jgi:hypothetical protein